MLVPYVRFAMHHVWLENYYINRVIWDNEFIFIDRGSLKFTIDGKVYIAKEKDLVVLRPNQHHIIEYNGEICHQPHVHFDFEYYPDRENVGVCMMRKEEMGQEDLKKFRRDYLKEEGIDLPLIIHLKEPTIVRNLLFNIIREYMIKKPGHQIILQGMMTELIGMVIREARNISIEEDNVLEHTIMYMNESVDQNLSLEDFANRINVSKWSLIQAFNEEYNISPMKYYNNLRYLRAKDLVINSLLPINDISYKMGFNEPQTFSRWFKNMDGFYPTHYRNKKIRG